MLRRDQSGRCLLTGQTASGIEGGAILFQALALNCGNLRRRYQAKGPSRKSEADSSEAPPTSSMSVCVAARSS